MKLSLLALPFAAALFCVQSASAQTGVTTTYDELAAEHGLDSVDYPGFGYYMEWGMHRTSSHTSPMRYEPSAGAPLFAHNPGFESGDFSNWMGSIGDNTVSSAGPLQNIVLGIYTGAVNPNINDQTARHSIMQLPGAANDPEGFPQVPAGYGNNTVRLGNSYAQYQGQTLQQTWVASANDTAFVISYAVVMYDGSHPVNEGSYFQIDLLDANQTTFFSRHDESGALPPIYQPGSQGDIDILPWRRDTFDLSAYAGQSITLRFTAAGCIWGGHYCYAYIDCDPDNANTVGISEHTSTHVNVYPNPSPNGIYNVNVDQHSGTPPVVIDITGRVVNATYTATASGWIVDLSGAATGSYTLCVPAADGMHRTTLIR